MIPQNTIKVKLLASTGHNCVDNRLEMCHNEPCNNQITKPENYKRRRRYASGIINPFLPTEVYEAKRKALLETGSSSLQEKKTKRRDDRVVNIRVNPIDCISVLDVLEKQGTALTNLSFAQAVKIVLASSLETFRQMNYIPVPDGFSFLQRMAPFEEDNNRVAMLNITKQGDHPDYHAEPLYDSPERKQRRIRYEELESRYKGDPINFSEADMTEYAELMPEFQR